MKECDSCGNEAGKTTLNETGDLCCQGCGDLLCENCAVYGFDILPRCEECHFKHTKKCYDECRGNKESTGCEYCEFC